MVTWPEMCFVWHAGDGLWRRLLPLEEYRKSAAAAKDTAQQLD